MERDLFATLTGMAMQNMQAQGFAMPKMRFFQPTEVFWELLTALLKKHETSVLEIGAGNGDLFLDGIKRGVTIQGIDSCRRDGVSHVLIADAVSWDYKPGTLALCCRPDHSGWAGYALEKALEDGASFMYVGLEHNLLRDLGELVNSADFSFTGVPVGEEGEMILGWGPMFAINCKEVS
jgi:hypothetical protein